MHDGFVFQIRPVPMNAGFELHGEGILADPLHTDRFLDAIAHAIRLGRRLAAEIHIFDLEGVPVETLSFR